MPSVGAALAHEFEVGGADGREDQGARAVGEGEGAEWQERGVVVGEREGGGEGWEWSSQGDARAR